MSDVRKICKLFLDFVYDNNVLPDEVVQIINYYQMLDNDRQKIKYDIRVILNILRYRNTLKPYDTAREVLDEIVDVINKNKSFDISVMDGNMLKWLADNKDQFDFVLNYCNKFFHDVEREIGQETFITAICEIIKSAPKEFEKDKYIGQIDKKGSISGNGGRVTITDKVKNTGGLGVGRARYRIPKWAYNRGAANHEIMKAYFKVESMYGADNVTKGLMKSVYRCDKPFDSNFANMKTDKGNAHGHVFDEYGGKVFLWAEIKDVALQYRDEFLKE